MLTTKEYQTNGVTSPTEKTAILNTLEVLRLDDEGKLLQTEASFVSVY